LKSSSPRIKAEIRYDFRFGRYGFLYFTAAFFLISLVGHAIFAWFSFTNEQIDHQQAADFSEYMLVFMRDVLENWQSEFLQLIWQVAGLAFLLHVGSPQSKEGDDRKEEKIDAILEAVAPKTGKALISEIDRKFARKRN
jgi:hypothetical protein